MSKFLRKMTAMSAKPEDFKKPMTTATAVPGPVVSRLVSPDDNNLLTAGDNSQLAPVVNNLLSTGTELWTAEGANGVFTASRISRIRQAQDGLTHREEKVYDVLWGTKSQSAETARSSQIGYAELARRSRVDRRTVIRLVDRLIEKGYISVYKQSDARTSTATVYQVLSYAAVLKFQRETGRQWILKTGTGVFYAKRLGDPVVNNSSLPVVIRSSSTGVSNAPPSVVAIASPPVVGTAAYKEGNKEEGKTSSSDTAAVHQSVSKYLTIDDDAVRLVIRQCRRNDPECTPEEIAYFAGIAADKIRRQRNADNPVGLLISQVPLFFPGAELTAYRARKAKELQESRELARRVLSDPESPAEVKEWARTLILDSDQDS